jgi:hypothetical protein
MSARDPLSAIPVAASNTSLDVLPSGGGLLRRSTSDAGGVGAWLARTLDLQRQRSYELDELGACFWGLVDGQRCLSDIQVALCQRHALTPEQARRAIVEFTATLMRRNLLGLRVPPT